MTTVRIETTETVSNGEDTNIIYREFKDKKQGVEYFDNKFKVFAEGNNFNLDGLIENGRKYFETFDLKKYPNFFVPGSSFMIHPQDDIIICGELEQTSEGGLAEYISKEVDNNFENVCDENLLEEGDRKIYSYYLHIETAEGDDLQCHGCIPSSRLMDCDHEVSKICFRYEDVAYKYAEILSKKLAEKYPDIKNIGVMVVYQTWDDSNEDGGDCQDDPWENAFFLNGRNIWDENDEVY